MRVIVLITTAFLFLSVLTIPAIADRGVGSIDLSANPNTIAADGKSTCTINAQVRNKDGGLVPDDTEIQFSASLGVIQESATTSAGVARVKLVSSDIPGTCIVTATWLDGQAVAQTNVEFGDAVSLPQGRQYITIEADKYLAYSIDYRILEALGDVKIRYRSLELQAHEVQIDLDKNRIVAIGGSGTQPVKLSTESGIVEADMFTCDLSGTRGLLLSAGKGAVQEVDLSKAKPTISTEEVSYMSEDFDLVDLSDSTMLVKAKAATIFPNEKIQFKSANVYVNGKRMLSLPYYLLSLTGYAPDGEQYVGYSTGGITLNLPVYYSLTPSSSGALLMRHGDSTGWGQYGQKPGWFIDARQKYATDKSQGMLTLNRITNNDWGAQISHNQDLGNQTQAYLYMDYPAHQNFFGSLNLNKGFKTFNMGLSLDGSKYVIDGNDLTPQSASRALSADVYIQTLAKKLGKSPLKYTLSARTQHYYTNDSSQDTVAEWDSTQRLDANIYSMPMPLGRNLTLRNSVSLGYVMGDSNTRGLSKLGTAVLDWKLSKQSNFQLSYRFTERPSISVVRRPGTEETVETLINNNARQTLSAMLRLGDSKKWYASVYAIKGLDYSSANIFADFSYRLSNSWRLGMRSTTNNVGVSSYDDFELSLGKRIGNRELLAVWSKSQNKIMFELGSAGF